MWFASLLDRVLAAFPVDRAWRCTDPHTQIHAKMLVRTLSGQYIQGQLQLAKQPCLL